jgi:cob(I)alamin adenosyltransferase
MKVYTKTGDTGVTSLYDGNRVSKYVILFDVIGHIDELTCRIGLLKSYLNSYRCMIYMIYYYSYTKYTNIISMLDNIQLTLQHINSIIATVDLVKREKLKKITIFHIDQLEDSIDYIELHNAPITTFVIPGQSMSESYCHLCRTMTRECERLLYEMINTSQVIVSKNNKNDIDTRFLEIDNNIFIYFNRLSDLFFVLARMLENI